MTKEIIGDNIRLIAGEGLWLTQVGDVDITERVISKDVYTTEEGISNWKEIDDSVVDGYRDNLRTLMESEDQTWINTVKI